MLLELDYPALHHHHIRWLQELEECLAACLSLLNRSSGVGGNVGDEAVTATAIAVGDRARALGLTRRLATVQRRLGRFAHAGQSLRLETALEAAMEPAAARGALGHAATLHRAHGRSAAAAALYAQALTLALDAGAWGAAARPHDGVGIVPFQQVLRPFTNQPPTPPHPTPSPFRYSP